MTVTRVRRPKLRRAKIARFPVARKFFSECTRGWDARHGRHILLWNFIPTQIWCTRFVCATILLTCGSPIFCATRHFPYWKRRRRFCWDDCTVVARRANWWKHTGIIPWRAERTSVCWQRGCERGRRDAGGAQAAIDTRFGADVFARLNKHYFAGRLHRPRLGWSRRNWRAQLGCFDPGLDQIVMNTRLDRDEVPPVRRGICALSRNAARAASDPRGGLRAAGAQRGVPRGRTALRALRSRA